jgi:WD40 repeat protein/serine/threonine protein kinase
MTANFDQLREIFLAALEQAPEERNAYLNLHCAGDEALRRNVAVMLKAHAVEEGPLDRGALRDQQARSYEQPTERLGTMIGPYKLLEQIGEGAFGVVFMAEQEKPMRRKVALKVLKPGMDTRQVVARFEVERQALALMDHPNIAKIHDAGTTASGRPYFVMELVRGVPITEFCDQRRLTPRQRLELFVTVCQAVQHAHQKGIIHRDLKPSNVLATLHDVVAVPKVIDFGIAKATTQRLTERTLFTHFAQMIGTPLYMSPEQAEMNGLDVDTRSDVYALGVLLYELLTGTTPFESDTLKKVGLDEMRRIIREEEPPTPSQRLSTLEAKACSTVSERRGVDGRQLGQVLRGEVDWIVMKALEKDRNRRYESASAFAADVQRYLDDEPVEACPPSVGYRLKKFARRNKAALGMVAIVATALVIGTGVSVWQAVEAHSARLDADARLENEKQAVEREKQARHEAEGQKGLAQEAEQKATAQQKIAVEEGDKSRRLLYASDMNLALHAWEAADTGHARDLLERQWPQAGQDDLRGFEWRYLWRLCRDASRQTLRGHTGAISAVAFAPDGKTLATSGADNSVRIWDLVSNRHVKLLGYKAVSVAFTPDGRTLAIADGGSRSICFWDVGARCQRAAIPFESGYLQSMALSPDGKLLATGDWHGTVRVGDIAARRQRDTLTVHRGAIPQVLFSPDGKTLATGGFDGKIRFWDTAERRGIASLEGHTARVLSLAFSPDGKTLASSGEGNTVRLWDTATRQVVNTLRERSTAAVRSVVFSPDGQTLATGGEDGTVRLWNAGTQKVVALLRGHTAPITALAYAPDGQSLVSGCDDGTVKVWDIAPGSDPNALAGHMGPDPFVVFSPDGQTLAVANVRELTVTLWDLAARQPVAVLKGHTEPVFCVTFAPGGQTLASTDDGGTVKLWDVATKTWLADLPTGFKGGIMSASFSPDGKLLAVGHHGGQEIVVWDVATRRPVRQFASGHTVQFSPDGKLLATCSGNTVRLWDVATWEAVADFAGQTAGVLCLAFAPDGRTLAVGDSTGTLRLWDVAGNHEVASRRGHTSNVRSVTFSPDGRRLATGGGDFSVKLWDLAPLQVVASLTGHDGPVNCVAFSPDGNALATASADGSVRLWQAPPLPAGPPKPADATSMQAPFEVIHLFSLELHGTAQATLTAEGNVCRVDITAVDDTVWHAKVRQIFDDLQEGATYTVRFRAKADAERRINLDGQIDQPDWHLTGLDEIVPLTENWQDYHYTFQAKGLARLNRIQFFLGEHTGTVWITDFSLTKGAP